MKISRTISSSAVFHTSLFFVFINIGCSVSEPKTESMTSMDTAKTDQVVLPIDEMASEKNSSPEETQKVEEIISTLELKPPQVLIDPPSIDPLSIEPAKVAIVTEDLADEAMTSAAEIKQAQIESSVVKFEGQEAMIPEKPTESKLVMVSNKVVAPRTQVPPEESKKNNLPASKASQGMDIRGVVRLLGKGAATANIDDAVVYFIPDDKAMVTLAPGTFSLDMARKQFSPRVIAAPVGSDIKIPNRDDILHNAFSPSDPNQFDTELYGKDEPKSFTLEGPGVVRIYCNVHFNMVAYVLALETSYYTQPNQRGEFVLENLPAVQGQVIIWHERTKEFTQTVKPADKITVNASMRITRRRIPQHSNKFGDNYRKRRAN